MHTGNNHVFQVYRCVSSLCFAVWKNTTCSNMALSLSLPCRALSTATTVTQKRVKLGNPIPYLEKSEGKVGLEST